MASWMSETSRLLRVVTLVGLTSVALPASVASQSDPQAEASPPRYDASLLQALEYRLVGPYRGGRVSAVAGVPDDPTTFYMGSTGGGVWRTDDAGESWYNISDEYFGSASVGGMAIAPSDPNVLYVGMGEVCIRHNVSAGDGIYGSVDGGRTWKHLGLRNAGQIGTIRVHPDDPDLVYAAVFGHAFGPNPERGVFRSSDGGDTWQRVLFVSEEVGAADLAMDPSNPRILYATMWEAVRKPWTLSSGGEGSGLFRSMDGGDTWEGLTRGLPQGIKGRIGVTVSPANPDRVWAIVEAHDGGLFRSDDRGESFRLINSDRRIRSRAYYYMHIRADPVDENAIYALNVGFFRSVDAGVSFERLQVPHADNHDLWINPANPGIMVLGNDGGATVTFNGGVSWSTQANQPTAELYRVSLDNQFPYRLYAGQQDNTTISIPSRKLAGVSEHWYAVGGGEQGHIAVRPDNPNIVFAGNNEAAITRYDHATGEARSIMTYPELGEGKAAIDFKYRHQMHAPIRLSPHDPDILYYTSQFVHRSRDEGQSWTIISPDLTRDDETKQGDSGGPITFDNWTSETYGTVFAFEPSPHAPGLLWAGTDDGLVHISRDEGASWEDITPRGMPEWGTVNMIDLSAHAPGRVFIAVHRYREDDFRPYIFRTDDYGESWALLTDGLNGIPSHHFVRAVREDPDRRGLLYAGTEYGMYVSFDDGGRWQPFQLNLPVTPITDIAVHEQDLSVSTQGRSFWILDDLTPLHHLTDEVAAAEAYLYPPRTAYRVAGASAAGPRGGENPPDGVVVHYHLGEPLRDELTLQILDSAGEVIRTASSGGEDAELGTDPGMHRWVWDLRYPGPELIEGLVIWGGTDGPRAVPRTYRVRMSVGDRDQTRSFRVLRDPRVATTDAEFREQFELAIRIRDRATQTHRDIQRIHAARSRIEELGRRAAARGVGEEISQAAEPLLTELTRIEESLRETRLEAAEDAINFGTKLDNQLIFLMNSVLSADARPTDSAYERYQDLDRELTGVLSDLERLMENDLPSFIALAERRGVPTAVP